MDVVPAEKERVTPAEDIDGFARLEEGGDRAWRSACAGCGISLARHEYTADGAYEVTVLHPELRPQPARHPNGLRYFTADPRVRVGRPPRRGNAPIRILGAVYVVCPGCQMSQSVFGTPTKYVFGTPTK